MADLESTLHYSLRVELAAQTVIKGEVLIALKKYISVLAKVKLTGRQQYIHTRTKCGHTYNTNDTHDKNLNIENRQTSNRNIWVTNLISEISSEVQTYCISTMYSLIWREIISSQSPPILLFTLSSGTLSELHFLQEDMFIIVNHQE